MAHIPGNPVGSQQVPFALRNVLRSWDDDLCEFDSKYRDHAFRRLDPLYAVPADLLTSIEEIAPDWLTPTEIEFERNLAALCLRHFAVGIFHGSPVGCSLLTRAENPALSDDQFQASGLHHFMTFQEFRASFGPCLDQLDPLHDRSKAFVGWLLTNPEYLVERDDLRARWDDAIRQLGTIPAYPVKHAVPVSRAHRPPKGKDVLPEFALAFNNFYERWQLRHLATWDLPEPCGANLTGDELPFGTGPRVGRFTLDVPSTLRLPANFPLRESLEEFQRRNTPDHLRPWLGVQDQQHDDGISHGRFANMFLLAFYRDTVLASRYDNRFTGFVEKLDEAFGQFLSLNGDSVKKLRLKMTKLRNRPA